LKRSYQREWQSIKFSDFYKLSETELPGPEFYNAFYRVLFNRYSGYDDLDPSWRQSKKELADWIAAQVKPGARVLSVGCGLGYMEACLHRDYGSRLELHVSDYASDAMRWLRTVLTEDRVHPAGETYRHLPYDLIYFSAVDYAVRTNEMVDLLVKQKNLLVQSGTCLMISASYLEESNAARFKNVLKDLAKRLLKIIGLYDRGQFWGWYRTRSEYQELMRAAAYSRIEDGFIRTPGQQTYFIKGQASLDESPEISELKCKIN
jgi:hypothetical protein